jgi:hypothetical protein
MTRAHLTDDEVQQFVSDGSTGDPAIAAHIHICEECKAKVETYQLLFTGLKEQPSPVFDFDLEQLVMQRLQPARRVRIQLPVYWVAAIGLAFSGIIVFLFRDYLAIANGLFVFLALISTIPVIVFLCTEMFNTYQKKMKLLEI